LPLINVERAATRRTVEAAGLFDGSLDCVLTPRASGVHASHPARLPPRNPRNSHRGELFSPAVYRGDYGDESVSHTSSGVREGHGFVRNIVLLQVAARAATSRSRGASHFLTSDRKRSGSSRIGFSSTRRKYTSADSD